MNKVIEELKKGNFLAIKESPFELLRTLDYEKLEAMVIGCGKNKEISLLYLIYLTMEQELLNNSFDDNLSFIEMKKFLIKSGMGADNIMKMPYKDLCRSFLYVKSKAIERVLQNVAKVVGPLKEYDEKCSLMYEKLSTHERPMVRLMLCANTIEPNDFIADESDRISNLAIERVTFDNYFIEMDEEEKECIKYLTDAFITGKIIIHYNVKSVIDSFEDTKDTVSFTSSIFKAQGTLDFELDEDLVSLSNDKRYAAYFLHQLLKDGKIKLADSRRDSFYRKYAIQILVKKMSNK